MAKWYEIPRGMAMSEREYDANIRGLNILFGAVLGFVLAGASDLPQLDFALVLFLSASIVVSILYLAHSDYKLFYGVLTAFVIFMLPRILDDPFGIPPITQLQPTLAVWMIMVIFVECFPRKEPAAENLQTEEKSK